MVTTRAVAKVWAKEVTKAGSQRLHSPPQQTTTALSNTATPSAQLQIYIVDRQPDLATGLFNLSKNPNVSDAPGLRSHYTHPTSHVAT